MTVPHRIQRRRTKGWRMPKGAVYVGRPTAWGNPFRVGGGGDRREAKALYEAWIRAPEQAALRARVRRELRGRDLVCWCPLDVPCHADVLIGIANGRAR